MQSPESNVEEQLRLAVMHNQLGVAAGAPAAGASEDLDDAAGWILLMRTAAEGRGEMARRAAWDLGKPGRNTLPWLNFPRKTEPITAQQTACTMKFQD